MSNNPDYDACIAVPGNTPAMCAATFGGPGEDTEKTLDDYIGLAFLNPATAAEGILEKFQVPGGQPAYYLDYPGKAGAGKVGGQRLLPGSLVVDPRTRQSLTIGTGRMFTAQKLSDSDMERIFGVSYAGAGAAPAWSSTRGAQVLAAQQAEEQARRDFERQQELDRIRAENDALLQARSDLRAIAQTAATIQAQEREGLRGLWEETQSILGETLGKDVVRGAIRGQGRLTRGVTPMEGYRQGVQQMGTEAQTSLAGLQPLPTPNLEAGLPETQAQIEQYQGLAQPREIPSLPAPGPFMGLEYGGEIKKKGEVMPFGERPDPRTSMMMAESMGLTPRIVGERSGGPELALLARGSKVIPLSDDEETELVGQVQGAQAGFGDFKYDVPTVHQALSPVYEHLGLSEIPQISRLWEGGPGQLAGGTQTLGRMGQRPRLVHSAGTVYWIDEQGRRRGIPSMDVFNRSGFRMTDVLNVSPDELLRYAPTFGPTLTEPPPLIEPGVSRRRFPPSPEAITIGEGPEGLRGMVLAAPRTFASIIRNVSPSTRAVIASALGLANYLPEDIEEELRYFTPGGTATAPRAALLA